MLQSRVLLITLIELEGNLPMFYFDIMPLPQLTTGQQVATHTGGILCQIFKMRVLLERFSRDPYDKYILWQMWVFERISVVSHMRGLCLHAASVLSQRLETSFHSSWVRADHTNVSVRTLWDNSRLYDEVSMKCKAVW